MRCLVSFIAVASLAGCGPAEPDVRADLLIAGGLVYTGNEGAVPTLADVAVRGDEIVFVGDANTIDLQATRTINAAGRLVTAGFIDPHTHARSELESDDENANLNYLHQGVTTVVIGNDGGGTHELRALVQQLEANGIGSNVAAFVGHGAVRRAVIGGENRAATPDEIAAMQALVESAMRDGALGLSTGLFYVPGSYADTDEVVALTEVAHRLGGLYDSHIRDESSYTIGLVAAIDEAIEVGRRTGIAVHIAHIKALGVDVWGQSSTVIERIEAARANGLRVTADQYPWPASGTHLHNALLPKSFLDGDRDSYREKLADAAVLDALRPAVAENLRRRGGADALLIVAAVDDALPGNTLADVAGFMETDPVSAAFALMQAGAVRVASFNMQAKDIENFMRQDWVVTSSDGTDGHPRKYASFPKKYRDHVGTTVTLEEFLFRSSALTADVLGLRDRGRLEVGAAADIVVLDLERYKTDGRFFHLGPARDGRRLCTRQRPGRYRRRRLHRRPAGPLPAGPGGPVSHGLMRYNRARTAGHDARRLSLGAVP